MRLNLIIAVMFCLVTSISAQVQFGVKASYGVNYNGETSKEYVNLAPLNIHNIAANRASAKVGLGVSVYSDNDRLFVMGDAQYVTGTRNFALQSINYKRTPLDPEVTYTVDEADLRMSALGGFKFNNFKIGVGPEFSLNLDRTEDLTAINEIASNEENIKAGFTALIGYEFLNHVHLDLKHTYLFDDVTSGFTYQGIPMDMKSNLKFFELSLGLYF